MTFTRKIGDTVVSPVGLGAMNLSFSYAPSAADSDDERFKASCFSVLDAAYDAGSRHWDTADIYGDSEELIGKWFARTGKRSEIFLATKFGNNLKGDDPIGTPEYMQQQFDQSLKRLGVDYVDLYYLHRPSKTTPIELSVGAMAELVKQGKVKYLGLSECTANDLRRAHAVHPISAYEVEYSPIYLGIEKNGTLDACRELGITVVAYSPLARGLLSGQFKSIDDFVEGDARTYIPNYSKENFPKFMALIDKLTAIGDAHKVIPGQVGLAWILAQGDNIVVIPGTRQVKYVQENAGAMNVHLTVAEVATIRQCVDDLNLVGDRFPAIFMAALGYDTPALKK
ncbi:Aldo/keto reductase [Cylindrobasidium torrendii FP15055 ss-10]|uniref:Aldo/keto reductase n=1 Tax=Cylindrobasidium torrendii FP15055 ss-10 TaxID=1314674 RepID=A0A0D7BJW5_9AGAR|nr:Aldo/keto reductase [Cylindrobasidium torrendii FP15055 ss-10]